MEGYSNFVEVALEWYNSRYAAHTHVRLNVETSQFYIGNGDSVDSPHDVPVDRAARQLIDALSKARCSGIRAMFPHNFDESDRFIE